VAIYRLCFSGDKPDQELLYDEAVESIGKEDYDRMVSSLGQGLTDTNFGEKRTGGK
jgi:hypothetical protein